MGIIDSRQCERFVHEPCRVVLATDLLDLSRPSMVASSRLLRSRARARLVPLYSVRRRDPDRCLFAGELL